ncbi:hypothetical protein D3C72_1177440 [compost metagenome]
MVGDISSSLYPWRWLGFPRQPRVGAVDRELGLISGRAPRPDSKFLSPGGEKRRSHALVANSLSLRLVCREAGGREIVSDGRLHADAVVVDSVIVCVVVATADENIYARRVTRTVAAVVQRGLDRVHRVLIDLGENVGLVSVTGQQVLQLTPPKTNELFLAGDRAQTERPLGRSGNIKREVGHWSSASANRLDGRSTRFGRAM